KIPAFVASVLLLLAGAYFFIPRSGGGAPTIAIPANGAATAASGEFARSVALDLSRYRAGQMGKLRILRAGEKGASKADYRVEVGVSGGGMSLHVDLALSTPRDSNLLWTTALEGREAPLVDLRQQAVSSLGSVLSCLNEVPPQRTKVRKRGPGIHLTGWGRLLALQTDI